MSELRIYQQNAVDSLRRSLQAGHRSPCCVGPTGSGKTEIMGSIARAAWERDNRVLVGSPRIQLADQTVAKFASRGITEIGVIQAKHWMQDYSKPVQICSMQTLESRGIEAIPPASLVMIDECHVNFGFLQEWMQHPAWQKTKFIGFTATPGTRGMAQIWDDMIISSTIQELIDQGHLSKFTVYAPEDRALPDLKGVKTTFSKLNGTYDYAEKELAKRMLHPRLVADVVMTYQAAAMGMPTLVYAVDRLHAKALQQKYLEAGIPAEYIDAHTSMTERFRIEKAHKNGLVKVVVNIGCLTMGVDWPWVECIQLCRPTKSVMLYTQIVGRGLRPSPETGKTRCLVLDHTETTHNLGLVTDIQWTSLDDGSKRKPAPPKEEEDKPKTCLKCHMVKPPRTPICPSCGHEAKPVCKVVTLKGVASIEDPRIVGALVHRS
jgi:superfamily II DNA or RNA helicase